MYSRSKKTFYLWEQKLNDHTAAKSKFHVADTSRSCQIAKHEEIKSNVSRVSCRDRHHRFTCQRRFLEPMITYSSTLRPGRDTLYLLRALLMYTLEFAHHLCRSRRRGGEGDHRCRGESSVASPIEECHTSRTFTVDIHCVSFLRPCHPRARFLFFLLFLRFSLFPLLSLAARLLFDSSPRRRHHCRCHRHSHRRRCRRRRPLRVGFPRPGSRLASESSTTTPSSGIRAEDS